MPSVIPLSPDQLYTPFVLDEVDFTTTDDLTELTDPIGQERAMEALQFGVGIERHGYNIFALGPAGAGKYTLARRYVERRAATQPPPSDWCYINNFDQPYKPHALQLPPGMGKTLHADMEHLVDELQTGLSAALESDEYQTRLQVLESEFRERQQTSLQELQDNAQARGLTLLRTPAGLVFAPYKDGNVLSPEDFQKLPEEERKHLESEVEELQKTLQTVLQQAPRWERELRAKVRELRREVTDFVINDATDDLLAKYAELPAVVEYLQAVRTDVSSHLQDFFKAPEGPVEGEAEGDPSPAPNPLNGNSRRNPALRRYQVNVLVDCSDAQGAPVLYEINPSYLNLVGRVEQMAQMGALVTDFTLIKPGVLHRANGGYLLIDARKLLMQPNAWEGLKRALEFGEIRIESPLQMMSLTSTMSLEPEPIPLDVKVILLGDRMLYYLLAQADPDFDELFKVAADFSEVITRDPESQTQYARLIATIVQSEKLRPFDKSAVGRVIEQSARMVGDSEKLSTRVQMIVDLLEETDHWAAEANTQVATAEHVQKAIDAKIRRADRTREMMQEQVLRETILVDTAGERVGQINGLAVLQLGNFAFGRASRITATVRLGKGEVVDIEREVAMSGPSHSKGVLILAGYLGGRYAQKQPLSLAANLVFEQSYGGIDGDSASSTELYALLSAIAEVPIRQSLAVTGSVNQHGEVQAIGGVNEKIEGFFDLCNARGLTGEQGVLIPAANVKHLMLRKDVVDAVTAGQFHIYPIETIDQGIEVLTGIPAGAANAKGQYPKGSINRLVAERLAEFAKLRREYDRGNEE
ncbi:MAG: AAA family ATPase [Caldilineaceae bacterium]